MQLCLQFTVCLFHWLISYLEVLCNRMMFSRFWFCSVRMWLWSRIKWSSPEIVKCMHVFPFNSFHLACLGYPAWSVLKINTKPDYFALIDLKYFLVNQNTRTWPVCSHLDLTHGQYHNYINSNLFIFLPCTVSYEYILSNLICNLMGNYTLELFTNRKLGRVCLI